MSLFPWGSRDKRVESEIEAVVGDGGVGVVVVVADYWRERKWNLTSRCGEDRRG